MPRSQSSVNSTKVIFERQLRASRALIDRLDEADDEVQGIGAAYLCVLVNGYIELYLRACIRHYLTVRSSPEVMAIIEPSLKKSCNFKTDRILQTFKKYKPHVYPQLLEFFENHSELKDALGVIVSNKNTLSHYGQTSTSLERVLQSIKEIERSLSDLHSVIES
jgi:hypothetical protein